MSRLVAIKKLSEIIPIIKTAKRRGMVVVTTNGAFDLLHIGHIRNLEFAKSLGDMLIVGVNSDSSVRSYKGSRRPIVAEKERAQMVAALKPVDHVFVFKEKTPISWIKKLRPDIHVKGKENRTVVELDALKKVGAKLVLAPFTKGKSSSIIITKIKEDSLNEI